MSDKKIAKAAHPIINAWRCQVDNILHQGSGTELNLSVLLTDAYTRQ